MKKVKTNNGYFFAYFEKVCVILLLIQSARPVALSQIFTENLASTYTKITDFCEIEKIHYSDRKKMDIMKQLKRDPIMNYEFICEHYELNDQKKRLLNKNRFIVIDGGGIKNVFEIYKNLKETNIPIFVTSDSLLNLFHVQFDQILLDIEQKELLGLLNQLSEVMLEDSYKTYKNTNGILKEAAKRNTAFFAVGYRLQNPGAFVPQVVKADVEREIQSIENHRGFMESLIFKYKEDFSQYIPRGHYNRNEDLKNFFMAMMWYGRMKFLLKKGLISEEDARVQTIQAFLIAKSLYKAKAGDKTALTIWNRIYLVTKFFVGVADDLTPTEYMDVMQKRWKDSSSIDVLTDEVELLHLKADLAMIRPKKIFGGLGKCSANQPVLPKQADRCFDETKGMSFLGQRFVPDSYAFQNLVNLIYTGDNSPFTLVKSGSASIRGFPRGLDLMALLGSTRAKQILNEEGDSNYQGYETQFTKLKAEFDSLNQSQWCRNLYWNLLFCLKALLREYGGNYPIFMQSNAWNDKQLKTALVSWVGLRHDTILYAKPSYTLGTAIPPQVEPTIGYVEPVPEFYSRLLDLTRSTERQLKSMDVLGDMEKSRLRGLQKILARLIKISKNEIEGRTLSDNDYNLIRNFGDILESVFSGLAIDARKSAIIADVHTDLNSGEVLQEGVGNSDLIIVIYKQQEGRAVAGVGPTFSYYEFRWPYTDRLTDKKWREILKAGEEPERPTWDSGFAY